jgi:hypothetical protein
VSSGFGSGLGSGFRILGSGFSLDTVVERTTLIVSDGFQVAEQLVSVAIGLT